MEKGTIILGVSKDSVRTTYLINEEQVLKEYIAGLSYEAVKALWKCNDKIAETNYNRFMTMDLKRELTLAILSYERIQYQYMALQVMNQGS